MLPEEVNVEGFQPCCWCLQHVIDRVRTNIAAEHFDCCQAKVPLNRVHREHFVRQAFFWQTELTIMNDGRGNGGEQLTIWAASNKYVTIRDHHARNIFAGALRRLTEWRI